MPFFSQLKRSPVVAILWIFFILGLVFGSASGAHQSGLRISKSTRKLHQKQYYKKDMDCQMSPEPVWIRNDCNEGFLAVINDRRVVTLNTNIDKNDNLGK